ncbi:hypothetical protein Tco_1109413 [Tanacetum coccineum]
MLAQPTPSPTHPSKDQSEPQPNLFLRPSSSNPIPDSILEGSGGNHGGQSSSDRSLSGNEDGLTLQSVYDLCVSLCKQVTTQAAQIKDLKAQIKQLKKKAKPVISHHNAWIKSVSMKKRLARKKSLKTKLMQKESVSKQGRKPAKSEPTEHKDPSFDDLDDAIDYMETDDAHDEGTVKDNEETRVSTEDQMKVAPTTVFRDDETIAQFLVTMSQNKTKQKGFKIKEIKDTDRPRTTTERLILTLKPLSNIDPKDKGKNVLEEKAESDAESEGVNARIEADSILAARLQEEEREKFTIEERAKLLHDTIAAQRRFLAQQRAAEIRRGKKHSDLKNKFFEEIQVLYEKKAAGTKKVVSIKEESKEEAENDELKLCLTIAPDKDKEVDYEILDKKYPIIEWKTKYLGIKPQFDETKGLEESNLNVVIRSNGQRRYFSTLMRMISIFDRKDLNDVYKLVMDRYQNEVPEGFDRVLWGDLMIMFNPNDEDEFWNTQQNWIVVKKKYPLRRKVLLQMLELKLESEEDNTMALELNRFVKKLIAELEPEDSDGNEEDL